MKLSSSFLLQLRTGDRGRLCSQARLGNAGWGEGYLYFLNHPLTLCSTLELRMETAPLESLKHALWTICLSPSWLVSQPPLCLLLIPTHHWYQDHPSKYPFHPVTLPPTQGTFHPTKNVCNSCIYCYSSQNCSAVSLRSEEPGIWEARKMY